MNDIVIIGGGPVGLWTAIQLKKRNPDLSVIVHERYTSYRRSHVLRLRYSSLRRFAYQARTPAEETFYSALFQKNHTGFWFKQAIIRTQELEEILKRYAETLGVRIQYDEIKSAASLNESYPACKTFIGADGAHSLIRREIFNNDYALLKDLQYIVELKYDVVGKTKPLDVLTAHYRSIKIIPHAVFEYVGREKEGYTPITLRFFVPKDVYDDLGEASFKNPVTIENYKQKLPTSFAEMINVYLTIRKEILGDDPMFSSMRLSKLTLSVYGAARFAAYKDGAEWYLVGDAAMGVPYFRSLNAGFLCGSKFAQLWSEKNDAVERYTYYGRRRLLIEYMYARTKNFALRLHTLYIRVSAIVPWQVNKWRDDEVRHYMENLYSDDTIA